MIYKAGSLLLLIMLVMHPQVDAQNSHMTCDKMLQPIEGDLSYKWRNNRCEGLYKSKASAKIRVVSYLRGELSFDLERDKYLYISAPDLRNFVSEQIHIKAVAVPLKTYYQLDAMLPLNKPFRWPIDKVLRKAAINAQVVGLFGWIDVANNHTLVPLQVSVARDNTTSKGHSRLELIANAPVDIESWKWRSYSEGENIPGWIDARKGVIYAGERVKIYIPNGPTKFLFVEFAAKEVDGPWNTFKTSILRTSQE